MKRDRGILVLAGAGGQGVLTAARVLSAYFAGRGDEVVSGQLHGMAQRGGVVQSFVKVNRGLAPAIGLARADLLLGFEPVECVRALPLLRRGGTVLVTREPVLPYTVAQAVTRKRNGRYPPWPELEAALREVTGRVLVVGRSEAVQTPALVGAQLLGALAGAGLFGIEAGDLRAALEATVPPSLAAANRAAFAAGEAEGRAWRERGRHERPHRH